MEFKLPELGEGVYEAEAVRWLVEAGQTVKPGQTLLEVLTDKATMEVPAPFAGVIQNLLVEPGQKLTIGQAILQYEDKKGAVVAGQLADLAVLSADYFSVPEEEIKRIESVLTLVGGKVVHASDQGVHSGPVFMVHVGQFSGLCQGIRFIDDFI